MLFILGTDAAGRDHIANIMEKMIRKVGFSLGASLWWHRSDPGNIGY